MAKTVLNLEPDYEFRLIGISCHARDYRFCWGINKAMGSAFRRIEDYEVNAGKKSGVTKAFSQFVYDCEEEMKSYTIFSNRSEGGFLIPELKQADYLMILKGAFADADVNEVKSILLGLDMVLTAFEADAASLKSRNNLIF